MSQQIILWDYRLTLIILNDNRNGTHSDIPLSNRKAKQSTWQKRRIPAYQRFYQMKMATPANPGSGAASMLYNLCKPYNTTTIAEAETSTIAVSVGLYSVPPIYSLSLNERTATLFYRNIHAIFTKKF